MQEHASNDDGVVVADTQRWLQRAVIGLNLCPFAKAVEVKGQIHYAVSRSVDFKDLLDDLGNELKDLATLTPAIRDTTLLIASDGLTDFLEFNDFLAQANRLLAKRGYAGIFQIASLHPHYEFADAQPDDMANFTNRSPYPTLHILREESIDRAVKAFPHAETIFQANIDTMRRIGPPGWDALGVGASPHGKIGP
ncbi:DUF1415 domain-containing protein [Rhodoferax sp. AJA081-3]|uniref:DUF1415 domain-containing protein n=1 Tax=Rhodoferax sp. AJA081-3 TaxID=2752316 RepID=UPI001ADF5DE1|nr:DUF1415 domain-containing protein [Rhodoferax sp. AJA081-3]QTN27673.1 DUF1415 domain-containing protein [Rhodoferax sp. AJA081-3]